MSGNTYALTHDAENRLVGVSGAITAAFKYNGDGNRVQGTVAGVTTTYIGSYYEWTGSGSTQYYYSGSQRIAMRRSGYSQDNGLFWLFGDHLGSTSVTANSGGSYFSEVRYKAWGETRYTNGSTPTTLRFTGQRQEQSLGGLDGLYYYGARWYDPLMGRFIQPDSIIPAPEYPPSYDRYAYSFNNPVRYSDPSGHCPWCLPLALGILKLVDWGWTAWDTYQSSIIINSPDASQEAKLFAGLNIALAGLEFIEPDELLPFGLPADDIARKGVLEAFEKGGLKGGVKAIKELAGDKASEIVRKLYDKGIFEGVKSYGEWNDILKGVKKEAGLDVHHLIEDRFQRIFGLGTNDLPAVVLDRSFHQDTVTDLLRNKLSYRKGHSSQEIWNVYEKVYGDLGHTDWLDAIWPYFEKLGVVK